MEFLAPCLDVERMIIDNEDFSRFPKLPSAEERSGEKEEVLEFDFFSYVQSTNGVIVLSLVSSNVLLIAVLILTISMKCCNKKKIPQLEEGFPPSTSTSTPSPESEDFHPAENVEGGQEREESSAIQHPPPENLQQNNQNLKLEPIYSEVTKVEVQKSKFSETPL